jgi:uncharacterized protein YndB with AHSA1/START domain
MTESTAAVVTCVLPAPPDVAYDEWLDVDAFSEWMCPRPARPIRIAIEPRISGRLRIDIEELGQRFYVVGRYVALDRPRRLSFTWSCSTWDNPEHESVVVVTFDPHGDGQTLMTIEHRLLPAGLTEQHRDGWARIAKQLSTRLHQITVI